MHCIGHHNVSFLISGEYGRHKDKDAFIGPKELVDDVQFFQITEKYSACVVFVFLLIDSSKQSGGCCFILITCSYFCHSVLLYASDTLLQI